MRRKNGRAQDKEEHRSSKEGRTEEHMRRKDGRGQDKEERKSTREGIIIEG